MTSFFTTWLCFDSKKNNHHIKLHLKLDFLIKSILITGWNENQKSHITDVVQWHYIMWSASPVPLLQHILHFILQLCLWQTVGACSSLQRSRVWHALTFQTQLSEGSVTSRLQQLPHDPVRLLHVPLHHHHPPPVLGQDGRHGWAQDPGPYNQHIWLGGRWRATVRRTLWGWGL